MDSDVVVVRPPRVSHVTVLGADGRPQAHGILMDGELIASEADNQALTCGAVAEGLARALGAELSCLLVQAPDSDWAWEDLLPAVKERII